MPVNILSKIPEPPRIRVSQHNTRCNGQFTLKHPPHALLNRLPTQRFGRRNRSRFEEKRPGGRNGEALEGGFVDFVKGGQGFIGVEAVVDCDFGFGGENVRFVAACQTTDKRLDRQLRASFWHEHTFDNCR